MTLQLRRLVCLVGALLVGTAQCGAFPSSASEKPKVAFKTDRNVVFGSYSGLQLLLDVKTPKHPNGYALLHIPGSGFQAPMELAPYQLNDPARILDQELPYLEAGFTLFTINYRTAPRFKYPAATEDAQRAARFIRAHAGDYGVAPDWLGVVGASSGGTLALTLATLGEGSDQGIQSEAAAPKAQCVVAAMPATDLLALGQDGWAVALVTNYLDVTAPFPEEKGLPGYERRMAVFQEASPINHLDARPLPRMLLLHGDKDRLVPIDQSEKFFAAATAVGADIEFVRMPGLGHQMGPEYRVQAAAWMANCLRLTGGARPGPSRNRSKPAR